MTNDTYTPRPTSTAPTIPFADAQEAWFWFIQAQQARIDGARVSAGAGLVPRPCEPIDILNVVSQLHRARRLLIDHILVLRHYGRRTMAPDPRRAKEMRAHKLWTEALAHIEPVLIRKGIVEDDSDFLRHAQPSQFWTTNAVIFERGQRL